MRRVFSVWIMTLVIGTFVCSGGNSASPADEYDYDLVHSSVSFKAPHLASSRSPGRFNAGSAKLSNDREDPPKTTLALSNNTDSLDTANAPRVEHLRQPDSFETKQSATIEARCAMTKAIDG